jgi:hypothetical protein
VVFVLLALAHAGSQWLQGNRPLAAGILVAALSASVVLWRWLWPARSAWIRQLQVKPDGSACLLTADGRACEARLMPGSMRLGTHLLLVLRAGDNCHWLLLGPENVEPAGLAALRRRLRRPPAVPGLAVDSLFQSPRRRSEVAP